MRDKPKHSSVDRRPEVVPHHPKVLAIGSVVALVALALMLAWFWSVNTGQGVILTAEQQRAAEIVAERDAAAEEAAQQDKTDADLDREAEAKNSKNKKQKNKQDKGAPPPAPDASDTFTDQVGMTEYAILSQQGVLVVQGQLENVSGEELNGTAKAYVYIDGVPVATATSAIKGLQPGETSDITLISDSDYQPGDKVVLLEFESRK